jgi:hypothetical protein
MRGVKSPLAYFFSGEARIDFPVDQRPRIPFHTTKLGETSGQGNVYNPFILWFRHPPSSILPPILGSRLKTLLNPRNLVRRVGLQRIWVP